MSATCFSTCTSHPNPSSCCTTAGAYEWYGSGGTARSNTIFLPVELSIRNDHAGKAGSVSNPSSSGATKVEASIPLTRRVESMMLTLAVAPDGTSKSFFLASTSGAAITRDKSAVLFRILNGDSSELTTCLGYPRYFREG